MRHALTLPYTLCLLLALAFLCLPLTTTLSFSQTLQKVTVKGSRINILTFLRTKILRKEIEAKHAPTLAHILKNIPGVTITNSGGIGALSTIALDGGKNNHTLVLVEGMSAQDPSTDSGAPNLNIYGGQSFDYISVQKGALSSVDGSGSISGTVSLGTLRGEGKPQHSLSLAGGSRGTTETIVRNQGSLKRFAYNMGGSHLGTQGYPIKPTYLRKVARDQLSDKGRMINLFGRFDGDIGDNLTLTWIPRFGQSESSYNGYFPGITNPFKRGTNASFQQVFRLTHTFQVSGGEGEQTFSFGENRTKRKDGEDKSPFLRRSVYEGKNEQTSYRVKYERNGAHLLMGGDYTRLAMRSADFVPTSANAWITSGPVLEKSSYNRSIFASPGISSQYKEHRFYVKSSLRMDHFQGFGDHVTYGVGGIYEAPTQTQLKLSHATGFRSPTLYQRFISTPWVQGNVLLKPETSSLWQGGVAQKLIQQLEVEVTLFQNKVRQMVDVTRAQNGMYVYLNRDSAIFKGFEESLTWNFSHWRFKFTHTNLYTHDDRTRQSTLRRPKNAFYAQVEYEEKDTVTAGLNFRYAGKAYDFDPQTFLVCTGKSTSSLDAYVTYHMTKHADIFARIDNALNMKNEFPLGYMQQGLTFLMGAKIIL